ncbi:uncharacterized protein LOC142333628 [Lycorma delicatula]|uniref:uncharacterized protein LOC142333628 n=1 Tax=Lycorma delicatula TaxID=130591 RepID=UPI003F513B3C
MYVLKAVTSVILLITFIESWSEALSIEELDSYLEHYKQLKEKIGKKIATPFLEESMKGCFLCINEPVEHEIVQLNFYKKYLQKIESDNNLKIDDNFHKVGDSDEEYRFSKEIIDKKFDSWISDCEDHVPDLLTKPFRASFPSTISVDLINRDRLINDCLNDFVSRQVNLDDMVTIQKDYKSDLEDHESFAKHFQFWMDKPNYLCLDCINTFLDYETDKLNSFIATLETERVLNTPEVISTARRFTENYKKYKKGAIKWIAACGTHSYQEVPPEIDVSTVTKYIDVADFITSEGTRGLEKCLSTFVINSMVYYRPKFEVIHIEEVNYSFETNPSAVLKPII